MVALTATGLGLYLYRSFVSQIERRDDIELLGKLKQIQQLLSNAGTLEILRERPQYFRDTMSGQENSLVRIARRDGSLLIDINANQERMPAPSPIPLGQVLGADAIISWISRAGDPGRSVAGSASVGEPGQLVRITVARVYADRATVFAAYRWQIVVAATVSAALAALLAGIILRRGLRPLHRIASHAATVKPGGMLQKIDARDAPSELQPLIHSFNAMLARLQGGYERLSQFSADLAHEFRTPVANLLGQSQVALSRTRTVAEYEDLLVSNVEELERLSRMTDSMLFLARAQQESVAVKVMPLAVKDEFLRVCDFFENMAQERCLQLLRVGDGMVAAEAQLLRRALSNLLSNAIRHADRGSSIELSARHDADGVTLSVSNAGPAIAPQHLPHLFERFYRIDAARSDASGSTGLGLAIVSAIMQLHGGRANVKSQTGMTIFSLTFPAVTIKSLQTT